jgi:hypothetical protein
MEMATEPARAPTGSARLAGLFLLSASTLLFEVLLTKLFANKLEHHYTFAIIGLALLGYGGSGVLVQLKRETFLQGGRATGIWLWRFTLGWTFCVLTVVPLFLVLGLDPAVPGAFGAMALPIYFVLFSLPFFLAGVPVAAMLMSSDLPPSRVYFWDLLGAAAGAAAGPLLLRSAGAYAAVVIAAFLGLVAALVMKLGERKSAWSSCALAVGAFAIVAFLNIESPRSMRAAWGFDMVSFKALAVKADFAGFGPPTQTYWNAIARIDVSPTKESDSLSFRYGLPHALWSTPMSGRLILVDGGANTRQFLLEAPPAQTGLLREGLWAAPYLLHPHAARSLIIGAGGGVDILVAKAFAVGEVDALELNPDMFKLLVGRPEDPESEQYARWLRSDATTRVVVHNVEARHFAARHKGELQYDVILASGVDTLTAIQSSGNALSENFLYTADAVRDYVAMLRPGGILALSHWHLEPPRHALKMFATYLQVLDEAGAQNPGAHVCVVGDALSEKFAWETALLKKGEPFTAAQLQELRSFAARNAFEIVWEPGLGDDAPMRRPGDAWFRQVGRAPRAERAARLAALPYDVTPSTDDKPYFYWVNSRSSSPALYDGNWIYAEALYPQASMHWMLRIAILLSVAMAAAPAVVMLRRGKPLREVLLPLPFFALGGFAFVLAENAVFILATLFVGGPLYSLSVVLPAILAGYAAGSLLSARIAPDKVKSAGLLAAACVAAFGFLGLIATWAFPAMITMGQSVRMAISVAVVTPFAMVLGLFVPWYMARLKTSAADPCLAWMWSLSAIGNVVGSLLFVPICHGLGTRLVFALSCLLYLLALGWSTVGLKRPKESGA